MSVACEECGQGPREVFLQFRGKKLFDTRHVCAGCAGRILDSSRGWEIFDIDPRLIERLRGRLDQREPEVIRALLIIDYTTPVESRPAMTKAA